MQPCEGVVWLRQVLERRLLLWSPASLRLVVTNLALLLVLGYVLLARRLRLFHLLRLLEVRSDERLRKRRYSVPVRKLQHHRALLMR